MKITKRRLRRIIKEEKAKLISEVKVRRLVRRKLCESAMPQGPHSQVEYGDAEFVGYDAQVTVHDESGNKIDSWDVLLPPGFHDDGPEGWKAQGKQLVDMTDFVAWARSHNLFNLPAHVHEWDMTVTFEDVISDALAGGHMSDPFVYPSGTPGAIHTK